MGKPSDVVECRLLNGKNENLMANNCTRISRYFFQLLWSIYAILPQLQRSSLLADFLPNLVTGEMTGQAKRGYLEVYMPVVPAETSLWCMRSTFVLPALRAQFVQLRFSQQRKRKILFPLSWLVLLPFHQFFYMPIYANSRHTGHIILCYSPYWRSHSRATPAYVLCTSNKGFT